MSADTAFEVGRLYGPINTIANLFSVAKKDVFIGLPALEAYFPMSLTGSAGECRNHGDGLGLLMTGTVTAGYDGNSYRQTGNGVNYLRLGSTAFDLTGTETFVNPAIRGFTIGGWFYLDSFVTAQSAFISKHGPSPEFGYNLGLLTNDKLYFQMSGNGTSNNTIASTADTVLGEWMFLVGRFTPSVEIALFVNGLKFTNTTSIPAQCNASLQDFEIGRYFNDDARVIDARHRDVFLSRAILSDELIQEVRQATLPT